jgi:PhnB protein
MQMTVSTNLVFDGCCEEAFALYAHLLGGRITFALRYRDSPMAGSVPEAWAFKIAHATLTLPDGSRLLGADPAPGTYEMPRGFSLTVNPPDAATASAMFAALAEGGRVTQPLESTFWAAAFGTLIDRFGVPWAINCEAPQA